MKIVEKKRLPAVKTKIKGIMEGRYVEQEGLLANYIISPEGLRISRARVLATIVDKFVSEDKKFYSITIDDGSATMRCKAFKSFILEPFSAGNIVDIICKVRKYNDEIYVVPESIWKVDAKWEILRELEIREQLKNITKKREMILKYQKQTSDMDELKNLMTEMGMSPEEVEAIVESSEFSDDTQENKMQGEQNKTKVTELIQKLDRGEGCDYLELLETSGIEESTLDSVIEELLDDGECFEPRPGRIKKL
ncbi:MAG: OB-fold nucleic acid binding domain-containing protein [Candidatus Aenigmatarchaeota archaeon]